MSSNNQSFLKSILAPLLRQLSVISQEEISLRVEQEVSKRLTVKEKETYQFNVPSFFNMNSNNLQKPKPEGKVSYAVLRNFSIHSPIVRACIDYLKTKVIKLDYQIISEDPNEKTKQDDPRIQVIKAFFSSPLGKRSKYRHLIDAILEDYLVIGAFSLERIKTRGGQFLNQLKLVDSSTIQILIDQYGRLPEPPNPAFRQVIQGDVKAELTQDDLIYVTRGTRSNSPYGISPLESIIIQTESALNGALYSLKYFTDGNIPEGFGELPEGWDVKQIREFQDYFDAILSGNLGNQRKIKMVPHGFSYTPAKKPDDLGFEKFEGWLLQQSCAVFGVPPQDIGFTAQINKATSETQQEMGEERGMKPLAKLIEQVFTDIIQDDMGFKDLKFAFKDLDPVDAKVEAEVMEIKIRSGVLGVDEARQLEGLDPIGVGNVFMGTVTLATDVLKPKEEEVKDAEVVEDQKEDEDLDETEKADLRLWIKSSKNAFRNKMPFKKFQSQVLSEDTVEEIYSKLQEVTKKEDIEKVFAPYLNDEMKTIKVLERLANELNKIGSSTN